MKFYARLITKNSCLSAQDPCLILISSRGELPRERPQFQGCTLPECHHLRKHYCIMNEAEVTLAGLSLVLLGRCHLLPLCLWVPPGVLHLSKCATVHGVAKSQTQLSD